MKILLAAVLALSLGLNVFLWREVARQRNELEAVQASATELAELQQQLQDLQKKTAPPSDSADANALELARLRNEVSQLRKQTGDLATLRAQAAEAAQLRGRLAAATQDLAKAEIQLAQAVKISPEELQQAKSEAQAIACINNLKQIGLAARIYAADHNNVFPPDFITMKNELNSPKILFCPGDPTAVRVGDWSQLDPALISYRFLNPGGNETDPTKQLTTCPIHGHVGLSDGSVHRKQ
jgi:hypothetical protein